MNADQAAGGQAPVAPRPADKRFMVSANSGSPANALI